MKLKEQNDLGKFNDEIVKRFLQICEQEAITQYQIHKKGGIPKSTLSEFFSRKTKTISTDIIFRICNTLNISIFDFFNDEYFK